MGGNSVIYVSLKRVLVVYKLVVVNLSCIIVSLIYTFVGVIFM